MINPNPKVAASRMASIAQDIKEAKERKKVFLDGLAKLNYDYEHNKVPKAKYVKAKNNLLQGKTKEEVVADYDKLIQGLLDQMKHNSSAIKERVGGNPKEKVEEKEEKKTSQTFKLTKKQKVKYLKELGINKELLSDLKWRREKRAKEEKLKEYELYKSSDFGILANRLFEKLSLSLIKKNPEPFEALFDSLRKSGIKILSKTYVSMMFLAALIGFVVVAILASLLWKHTNIAIQVVRGVGMGFVGFIVTLMFMYLYPKSEAASKSSGMKTDLPFVTIHMAAVAGSGARPISIFTTVLSSGEYPNLRNEIRKVVNYVNIFGYDLSTALRAVSMRTPSQRFKDLLDGMVSTIDSGGSLKQYLTAKAEEALNTYKLERKKYVETIATYSDIYIAILIAGPLLFFVTLAIIQSMGGKIGGLSVSVIATIGTYVVIPLLNVGFMVFLSIMKPK